EVRALAATSGQHEARLADLWHFGHTVSVTAVEACGAMERRLEEVRREVEARGRGEPDIGPALDKMSQRLETLHGSHEGLEGWRRELEQRLGAIQEQTVELAATRARLEARSALEGEQRVFAALDEQLRRVGQHLGQLSHRIEEVAAEPRTGGSPAGGSGGLGEARGAYGHTAG
ncbi:unnamed protein product, partial [Prorocentrum cordatum]